jgi:uncharacterized protein (TIGR03435 family)
MHMLMKASCRRQERMVQAAIFMAAALLCATVGPARAQDAAGGVGAKPVPMAKDADPDWEVATVRAADQYATSDHIDMHGRHVQLENETVEVLLLFGYNVQKNQIANAPDWVKTERWTVDGLADVDGEPNVAQLQTMIRKVLTERFGLKLHREQREMAVYALTVAKGGAKLIPNTSDPDGVPDQQGGHGTGWVTYRYKNVTMPELGLMLLGWVDRPIVDQTGLQGRYDLQLKWTTDEARSTEPDAPPGLFTAIQEQTGLKLEPVKAMADVLAIDRWSGRERISGKSASQ